jgi:hypothetical protein
VAVAGVEEESRQGQETGRKQEKDAFHVHGNLRKKGLEYG